MEITNDKGANLVVDPIGGPILNCLAMAAASQAILVEYGALASDPTPFPLFAALSKGLTVRGYTLFELTQDPTRLAKATEYINGKLRAGQIKPLIDRVFPLAEIREAHAYMASNAQLGKIVVSV